MEMFFQIYIELGVRSLNSPSMDFQVQKSLEYWKYLGSQLPYGVRLWNSGAILICVIMDLQQQIGLSSVAR